MKAAGRLDYGTGAYVFLRVSGWVFVNCLVVLGCYVLLFMLLAGFEPLGFFSQLNNLAGRFVAADQIRRGSFMTICSVSALLLFSITAILRRGSLMVIIRDARLHRDGGRI